MILVYVGKDFFKMTQKVLIIKEKSEKLSAKMKTLNLKVTRE